MWTEFCQSALKLLKLLCATANKHYSQVFADFEPTTEKSLVSFSFADERFQAEQGISFPLEPAVQRLKIRKNKTRYSKD